MVDYLNAFHWFIHKKVGYQITSLKICNQMEIKTESLDYSFTFMAMSSYKMEGLMSNFYSKSQNMGCRTLKYAERTIYNLIYVYF